MKVQTSSNQPSSSSSNIDEETALDRLENSLLSDVSSVVSDDISNDTTTDSSVIGTATINNKQLKKEKNKKEKYTFECCICLNTKSKKQDYVMTSCKHEFCCSCLLKHITNAKTCPLCRHNIIDNCINTYQPIRIRQAINIMKMTIDNYDFEAEYNAMAAFNDINIMTSLIKTISVDCVRNVLQAQKDMNFVHENIDRFVDNVDNMESI